LGDPDYGYDKVCTYASPSNIPLGPPGYTFCAYGDFDTCYTMYPGTSIYGGSGKFTTPPEVVGGAKEFICSAQGQVVYWFPPFGDPNPQLPKSCFTKPQ